MNYYLQITFEARQDEFDAYNYYEDVREGLGAEFLKALVECYDNICKNPHAYSFVDKRKIIRDVKVKRFPYAIIFDIIGNAVIIGNTQHQQ